jgi:hypothetical protein
VFSPFVSSFIAILSSLILFVNLLICKFVNKIVNEFVSKIANKFVSKMFDRDVLCAGSKNGAHDRGGTATEREPGADSGLDHEIKTHTHTHKWQQKCSNCQDEFIKQLKHPHL